MSNWTHKHLLGIDHLSRADLERVFAIAEQIDAGNHPALPPVPAGRRPAVVCAFFEDSTRTRLSFSRAAQRLGCDVLDFASKGSSVSKGESLVDTARTIEAMGVEFIVVRHGSAGAAKLVADTVSCAVINAGDGAHEHPTQALLDCYTMRKHLGDLAGKHVAIVGDIAHSRVARSNLLALQKLGATVTLVGPPTLLPRGLARLGANLSHSLDEVLPSVDVVNMLRIQFERIGSAQFPSVREYTSLYGLTQDRLNRCKDDILVMHPGPMNRGVEIDSSVADGDRNVIIEQVANGVTIRMAVLSLLSSTPT